MTREEIISQDKQFVLNTYARSDLVVESGKGCKLCDKNGKEYLDFSSGIAVNTFGMADSQWIRAVTEQATKFQHVSNLYFSEPQVKLAQMLCQMSNMKKVFFSNSGAEANECALKCARKYSHDKYGENRFEIITLSDSFHGRTMATLTATGQQVFHRHFMPFLEGFVLAQTNDINDLRKLVTKRTAAIMLETIQGEGGVNNLTNEFFAAVQSLCDEFDLVLIVDEVQTGNGRTGKLYSYMNFDLKPDIVTTAKGLSGGLPLGACLFGEKTEHTLSLGDHGSTFGGNPICCAGALSILERLDDKLLSEVVIKGKRICDVVSKWRNVKSVSGKGLILGIETNKDAKMLAKSCLEKGLVVLTAKNKLRLLPALNISMTEIEDGLKILYEVIEK